MKRLVAVGVAAIAAGALLTAAALGAFAHGGQASGAKADGIAVEGAWKVTIKSADGRVLRVHRFHNEFNGASNVANILAHANSTGRYWMQVYDSAGTNSPCLNAGVAVACYDFEADDPNAGASPSWFGNLTASVGSGNSLVVKGILMAQRDGSFDTVSMLLSRCTASTAPSACHPGGYGAFSFRTLASPITLITGQQAIITVTYTFSAA